MTLVEFLRARHAEVRATAERAETGRRWEAARDEYGPAVRVGDGPDIGDSGPEWRRGTNVQVWQCDDELDGCPDMARGWRAEAKHIARHDPARVLAQVAATERIVDLMEQEDAAGSGLTDADGLSRSIRAIAVLRLLAAPFVDHSDYDESWKP